MSTTISAPTPTLPTTARRQRITSLDWARGWMVLANLVVIAYVYPSWDQLRHAQWLGVTVFDLIFPTFVTLSGCGLAFAYARRVDATVTARRVVVLFSVGLLYNAVVTETYNPLELRLAGPLQVYAVLVLVVALLHLLLHGIRPWAYATLGLATVWTAVSWAYNSQCPTGRPTRSCNLSAAIDLRFIPTNHLYRQGALGHDPEGLAAIIGALITMMVGVTAGKILLARFQSPCHARSPGGMVALHCCAWGPGSADRCAVQAGLDPELRDADLHDRPHHFDHRLCPPRRACAVVVGGPAGGTRPTARGHGPQRPVALLRLTHRDARTVCRW